MMASSAFATRAARPARSVWFLATTVSTAATTAATAGKPSKVGAVAELLAHGTPRLLDLASKLPINLWHDPDPQRSDLSFLKELKALLDEGIEPDRVRAAQAKRGLSADVVDRALAADSARRQAIGELRDPEFARRFLAIWLGPNTSEPALRRALASLGSSEMVLIVSADATAAHQSVINVMDAARRAGIAKLTFATQSSAGAAR